MKLKVAKRLIDIIRNRFDLVCKDFSANNNNIIMHFAKPSASYRFTLFILNNNEINCCYYTEEYNFELGVALTAICYEIEATVELLLEQEDGKE